MPKKRTYKKIPRVVLDLSLDRKEALDALCEAMFPRANASYSHLLRTLIEDACKKYKIDWPEEK